jgi:putative ABC transport system ATP-binding protein
MPQHVFYAIVGAMNRLDAEAPPTAFTLDQVSVHRGGTVLLSEISADIPAGACTALVGPSGAGKSTLLRLLNRLLDPTSGRVLCGGVPISDLDVLSLRRRISLIAQQPVLLTGRIADELRVGRPDLTDAEAAELLDRSGLPPGLASRSTEGLSGGEAQRLCLARSLAVGPSVLLLDEPTSALDARSSAAVEDALRALVADGGTVVIVSHEIDQARRLGDQVLVLAGGRLAEQGRPENIAYLGSTS